HSQGSNGGEPYLSRNPEYGRGPRHPELLMTTQPDFIRPPILAAWLVNLFAPTEGESILGDLLEEHSDSSSKSGVAFAQRWYWRQPRKTIAHLAGNAFRTAPWL